MPRFQTLKLVAYSILDHTLRGFALGCDQASKVFLVLFQRESNRFNDETKREFPNAVVHDPMTDKKVN